MIIHIYILLEGIFHSLNIHTMDAYIRWYAFKAAPAFNLFLVLSCGIIIVGLCNIYKKGKAGFMLYFGGKLALIISYLLLIFMEYNLSSLKFPLVIIPVLLLIQMIYPILLYISLRHSERIAKHRI